MHLFLAAVERKLLAQLPRFPSRAQLRRRFSIVHPKRERERETLPNFYQRFLQMKVQTPEESDDQVITQAIKAQRAGPLHSHLVRERPKIVSELYEQFAKFSKSKSQKQTKPLYLTTMKVSVATRNPCTTSTLMDVDHRRIARKIMGHHHTKQATTPPPTRGSASTTKGAE
jgi:hypothetical protein